MKKLTIEEISNRLPFKPRLACVLGSGLGSVMADMQVVFEADYADIEGLTPCGVDGHSGRLLIGELAGSSVAVMQGRVHYYEGHSMSDVVRPVRFLRDLGAKTLILTNAAGGVNAEFKIGDIMLLEDHILLAPNPLIGRNDEHYGTRFPDMSGVYDPELIEIASRCAEDIGIGVKRGVYVQLTGPSYETPAEIRALRIIGADAVGMSTAVEAVTARHAGMRVLGMSLVTNAAATAAAVLSHEEVKAVSAARAKEFGALLSGVIAAIK